MKGRIVPLIPVYLSHEEILAVLSRLSTFHNTPADCRLRLKFANARDALDSTPKTPVRKRVRK